MVSWIAAATCVAWTAGAAAVVVHFCLFLLGVLRLLGLLSLGLLGYWPRLLLWLLFGLSQGLLLDLLPWVVDKIHWASVGVAGAALVARVIIVAGVGLDGSASGPSCFPAGLGCSPGALVI